ncbi:MAG: hypothetical protein ABWK53_04140 [Anaerolineales bacterium]
MTKNLFFLAAGVLLVLLTACSAAGGDPAAQAVEDYLQALVDKDASALAALSCADWEAGALRELDSLQTVATRLEGLRCQSQSTDGVYIFVACEGNILATYNNEDQAIDLSLRTYQVVEERGDYLVCGYR